VSFYESLLKHRANQIDRPRALEYIDAEIVNQVCCLWEWVHSESEVEAIR
jgi:hypothetical protein